MNREPWSAADDAALRSGYAGGSSLGQLAEALGRSKTAVHRRAAALGLAAPGKRRAQTAAATAENYRQAQDRRVLLCERLYCEVEHLLALLRAPEWRTLLTEAGGAQQEAVLPFVPARDLAITCNAVALLIARVCTLEQRIAEGRATPTGQQEQESLLGALMDGLRAQQPTDQGVGVGPTDSPSVAIPALPRISPTA